MKNNFFKLYIYNLFAFSWTSVKMALDVHDKFSKSGIGRSTSDFFNSHQTSFFEFHLKQTNRRLIIHERKLMRLEQDMKNFPTLPKYLSTISNFSIKNIKM